MMNSTHRDSSGVFPSLLEKDTTARTNLKPDAEKDSVSNCSDGVMITNRQRILENTRRTKKMQGFKVSKAPQGTLKLKKVKITKPTNKNRSCEPIRERGHDKTLAPTPRLTDDAIKELIKKFPVIPSYQQALDHKLAKLKSTKKQVHNLVLKCCEIENEDEVPFNAKYQYRLFLENYYQNKFGEISDILRQMENIDTKLAKRFFDYSMLKIDEGLTQSNDIVKEYRSGLADP